MNQKQREYFLEQISKNKGSEAPVLKEEIVAFAQDCGIEFKKNLAKYKIINLIVEYGHLQDFYHTFSEAFWVPIWEVRKYYNIPDQTIKELSEAGIIEESPKQTEYRGRQGAFIADAYPISIFGYDRQELVDHFKEAYSNKSYKIRLETNTMDKAEEFVEELSKVFEIKRDAYSYRQEGSFTHFSYFNVQPISDSPIRENKLRTENSNYKIENAKLKMEVSELKKQFEKLTAQYETSLFKLGEKTEFERGSKTERFSGYGVIENIKTGRVLVLKDDGGSVCCRKGFADSYDVNERVQVWYVSSPYCGEHIVRKLDFEI